MSQINSNEIENTGISNYGDIEEKIGLLIAEEEKNVNNIE